MAKIITFLNPKPFPNLDTENASVSFFQSDLMSVTYERYRQNHKYTKVTLVFKKSGEFGYFYLKKEEVDTLKKELLKWTGEIFLTSKFEREVPEDAENIS